MRNRTSLVSISFVAVATLTACGDSPHVTGFARDTFQPSTGESTLPSTKFTKIAAHSGDRVITGTIDEGGEITIPDVPEGPYVLELTEPPPIVQDLPPITTFVETDARTIELGHYYSCRPNPRAMTQPTTLVLDATLTTPWQRSTDDGMGTVQHLSDAMEIVSRNAGVWGMAFDGSNDPWIDTSPSNGDTKIPGWEIDAQAAFYAMIGSKSLIDGSKGDEAVFLHDVAYQVGDPNSTSTDAWANYAYWAAQESMIPAPFTMKDGGKTGVSGHFEPAPQKTLDFDYKGTAFNALLEGVPVDAQSVSVSVQYEPGAQVPAFGAFAYVLDVGVTSPYTYSNPDPACHTTSCDPIACPAGCDPGKPVLIGDHSHTYTYGYPFKDGHERFSVSLRFSKRVRELLPEKTSESLRGAFTISGPVAEYTGKSIQPMIGLPQNIMVNGQATPYDQVTAVGEAPTITWDAPALGKPDRYQVTIVDTTDRLDDLGNVSSRRHTTAVFLGTKTRVSVPAGILESGKFYYVEVVAKIDPDFDSAAPQKSSPRTNSATMFTGILTP